MRQNRKKTFKGHSAAGYACAVGFSHDNHYVISGDGEGKLFVWDWKTGKVRREGGCIDQWSDVSPKTDTLTNLLLVIAADFAVPEGARRRVHRR